MTVTATQVAKNVTSSEGFSASGNGIQQVELAARLKNKDLVSEDKKLVISYLNDKNTRTYNKKIILNTMARIQREIFNGTYSGEGKEKAISRLFALKSAAEAAGISEEETAYALYTVSRDYLERTDKDLASLLTGVTRGSLTSQKKEEIMKVIAYLISRANEVSGYGDRINALENCAEYFGITRAEYTAYSFEYLMPGLKKGQYMYLSLMWIAFETPEKEDDQAIKKLILRDTADKMKSLLTGYGSYQKAVNSDDYINIKQYAFKIMEYHVMGSAANGLKQDPLFISTMLQLVFFKLHQEEIKLFSDYFIADRLNYDNKSKIGSKIRENYLKYKGSGTLAEYQCRDLSYILGIEIQ